MQNKKQMNSDICNGSEAYLPLVLSTTVSLGPIHTRLSTVWTDWSNPLIEQENLILELNVLICVPEGDMDKCTAPRTSPNQADQLIIITNPLNIKLEP